MVNVENCFDSSFTKELLEHYTRSACIPAPITYFAPPTSNKVHFKVELETVLQGPKYRHEARHQDEMQTFETPSGICCQMKRVFPVAVSRGTADRALILSPKKIKFKKGFKQSQRESGESTTISQTKKPSVSKGGGPTIALNSKWNELLQNSREMGTQAETPRESLSSGRHSSVSGD